MSPALLVKCCTKEILCVHRLWRIRGNIVYESQICTYVRLHVIDLVI